MKNKPLLWHIERWAVPLALLFLTLLVYRWAAPLRGPIDEEMLFMRAAAPPSYLLWGIFGHTHYPTRPLHTTLIGLLYKVVGWDMRAYLWLMPLLLWANTQLFYAILRRAFPKRPGFALSSALIFLVYPADTVRTIFGLAGCLQALAFFLIAVWIQVRAAESSDPRPIRPAILIGLCLAVSLMSYEQLILVILLWPLTFLILPRPAGWKPLLIVGAGWLTGPGIIALWRLYLVLNNPRGDIAVSGLPAIGASLAGYLSRYRDWFWYGLWGQVGWGFAQLRSFLALGSPEVRVIPLGVAALIAAAVLTLAWGVLRVRGSDEQHALRYDLRFYLMTGLGGLVFALLSYVVVPTLYTVGEDRYSFETRFHTPASLGYALLIAALVFALARLVSFALAGKRAARLVPYGAWGLIALFGTGSLLLQFAFTRHWYDDWTQKAAQYRAIMEVVPGMEPGSLLVIIDTPAPNALRLPGSLTSSVNILYGDTSLMADFVGNVPYYYLTPATVFQEEEALYNGLPLPYDRVIFVRMGGTADAPTAEIAACLPEHIPLAYAGPPPCSSGAAIIPDARPTRQTGVLIFGE